jgi:triosephosphate isomerase
VVSRQIQAVIDVIGIQAFDNVIIAYEPIWAIGTGLTATPDQAQDVHQAIRQQLAGLDSEIAEGCRILYGGSMKPENATELISKTDIDGGLIGGAALKAEDFLAICGAA